MTTLSVNINKVATLRNARGGNIPNVITFAEDVQRFGANGITVHPRPDERHIRYDDARELKAAIYTEYNIEGNPTDAFLDLVLDIAPTQVTLVPDAADAITSHAGWDTITHRLFLTDVVTALKQHGIRTSIFIDPFLKQVEGAKVTGADSIELYTEMFVRQYQRGHPDAIIPYMESAKLADTIGLRVNAGHDLSLANIQYFKAQIPNLREVSIGHALICESLYLGVENVVQQYLRKLA